VKLSLSSDFGPAPYPRNSRGAESLHGAPASPAPPTPQSAGADAAAVNGLASERATAEQLFDFGSDTADAARRLFEVYSDRTKLALRRSFLRTALGVMVGASAALWVGASILSVLRGACDGLAALWGGRVWMGQLAGGLLGVGLALGVLFLATRVDAWRQLRRLEAKYRPAKSVPENASAR
jgi:hypothetical protein